MSVKVFLYVTLSKGYQTATNYNTEQVLLDTLAAKRYTKSPSCLQNILSDALCETMKKERSFKKHFRMLQ